MARYACVHNPDSIIWEVRSGNAPPTYVPPDCQWIDVSSSPLSDQQLLFSTYEGGEVVPKRAARNLNPEFNMGDSMHEILTG
jgi:hypothetical protein